VSEPVYILKVREIQGIRGTHVVPRGGGKGESVCGQFGLPLLYTLTCFTVYGTILVAAVCLSFLMHVFTVLFATEGTINLQS
jgi:hypothetical protein